MEISKESQKKIREKLDSFKIKDATNSHAIETFEKVILKKIPNRILTTTRYN